MMKVIEQDTSGEEKGQSAIPSRCYWFVLPDDMITIRSETVNFEWLLLAEAVLQ